ncbi:MAG TPA: T9SS type B sorting domain-containing protein [Pricia sp.]|uniref:T9SS type B sorting domain-containing protein n=2 Tax=root TaxID=1 RepID=A0A831QLJ7_9FLAO|nr:T9SS type B sorting domain-containing protein [Pricia sp.]HEA19315.1 T9SS type B sorting domain-containing protein [Pricia antarctica]
MNRYPILFLTLLFLGTIMQAQVAPDCANAIPICNNTPTNGGTNGYGNDDFNGATKSGCLEQTLDGTIESNSAWYRFRTGASGQLGFNIRISAEEDWDFAVYKTDDCDTLGQPIRCNFFDNQDGSAFIGVGEEPTGSMDAVQYEDWLDVTAGEDYYLFINNFSNVNSGFSIQFSGNIFITNPNDALDCSIVDNLLGPPISACGNESVLLNATISDALQYRWFKDEGSGFSQIAREHDPSLEVSMSANYRVEIERPNSMVVSEVQVAFSTIPVAFPPGNEASCSNLEVVDFAQKDTIILGNQDAGQFVVSYHASLEDATNGMHALPKQYPTQFGAQTIFVRVSSIENPRCFDVSQSFQLINLETPLLDFPKEAFLCQENAGILIGAKNPNPGYTYSWNSGENTPNIEVFQAGTYSLTATNTASGISCSTVRTVIVSISRPPEITDIEIEDLSNNNRVTIFAQGTNVLEYRLDYGAYQTSSTFSQVLPGEHLITINDPMGCGSITEHIVVVGYPKFFTPNNDGVNDVWHISGLELLQDPSVSIFNRYGKLIVKLDGTAYNWVGTFRGRLLPESDYWFRLTYTNGDGQSVEAKYIDNHFSLKR